MQRVRIEREGPSLAAKQHAARSLKFFDDEYGCVGLRGVLPPLTGALLKRRLEQIADDAWRAAHPERASVLGGHGGEPYERRLGDALISLVNGTDNAPMNADRTDSPDRTDDTYETEFAGTRPGATSGATSGAKSVATAVAVVPRSSSPGRATVVVTINAETLEAEIVGQGPITFTEAAGLAAHADLYAAIKSERVKDFETIGLVMSGGLGLGGWGR